MGGRTAEPAVGVRDEVLDDHLRVLGDAALMRQRVPGEQRVRLGRVDLHLVGGFLLTSFQYVSYVA